MCFYFPKSRYNYKTYKLYILYNSKSNDFNISFDNLIYLTDNLTLQVVNLTIRFVNSFIQDC